MVIINQVGIHVVQGIFTASLSAVSLKHGSDGSELTVILKVSGDDVSTAEIAANLSALSRRVKVVIEGEAQQLTLWE